jgi:hypothetical protein
VLVFSVLLSCKQSLCSPGLPSVFPRELPNVIDELQVEVVDAPLGLILVPEKTAVISAAVNMRQTVRGKLFNRFQRRTRSNVVLKSSTPSSIRIASFAGSFVEQKNRESFEQKNYPQATSIRRRLNRYNFAAGLDYNYF